MSLSQSAICADGGAFGLFVTLLVNHGGEEAVRRAAAALPALTETLAAELGESSLVSAIAFGGKPEHGHCAARLRLVDGSVVHVSSFECRDRALTSRSEIFADLHLPLESVAEIILDPAPAREPPGPPPKKPAPGTGPTGAAAP